VKRQCISAEQPSVFMVVGGRQRLGFVLQCSFSNLCGTLMLMAKVTWTGGRMGGGKPRLSKGVIKEGFF
jgi:hypothetical protein